jgi:hypothetical protein
MPSITPASEPGRLHLTPFPCAPGPGTCHLLAPAVVPNAVLNVPLIVALSPGNRVGTHLGVVPVIHRLGLRLDPLLGMQLAQTFAPPRRENQTTPAPQQNTEPPRPSPTVENGGSSTIKFVPVDLRPHEKCLLSDGIRLTATGVHPADVKRTWTATATNVNGQASGAFTMGSAMWSS